MKNSRAVIIAFISGAALSLILSISPSRAYAENDSIYYYYALENRSSVPEMLARRDTAIEEETAALQRIVSQKSFKDNVKSLTPDEFDITLREVTDKAKAATEKAERAMDRLDNSNELRTVLLGNNIGTLEFELVQIKGLQDLLYSLISKTEDVNVKMEIKEQIAELAKEQKKIESSISQKENHFSLLGWLVATI